MFEIKHVGATDQARAAYDHWHSRHQPGSEQALFAWLLGLLAPQPGRTLLDIACGAGGLCIAARNAGLIYHGVDLSLVAAHSAAHRRVLVGDGARLPFADQSADYVTSVGSLEHYLDVAQGVRELARVLKAEGRACVLVPNAFGLTWNVLSVWRSGDMYDDDGQPIQRFATRGAWERILHANGLQVLRTLGYERAWPHTSAEWRRYRDQPKEALLALAAPLLPVNLMRCLVFVCGKASTQAGSQRS